MVTKATKPFLVTKKVKGRLYYYFRRAEVYQRIHGEPDTPEFDQQYWAIRAGKTKQVKTTFEALISSYYASPAFKKKAEGTKREYRRTLELIRTKNGEKDFTKLKRKDVIAARDAYSETWRKANSMVEMISILARHAIDLEWIGANPATGVEKLTGGEYEPWPQAKLDAFARYCVKNDLSWELTAHKLCVGSGQRIGDVVKMEWEHYDGEFISVAQEKTKARLWVACPKFLRGYLDRLPRSGKFIIAQSLHKGVSKRAIQQRVFNVRKEISADQIVIHGWRYNAAVALAEAGSSDSEIQAVTGHKTLEMVKKYRARANQKRLSKKAQARRDKA